MMITAEKIAEAWQIQTGLSDAARDKLASILRNGDEQRDRYRDLLIRVIPYLECIEDDQGYKQGAVKSLIAEIKKAAL